MPDLRCPRCRSRRVAVAVLKGNYSAFGGYRFTPSDYSGVRCLDCGAYWRTRSDKVYNLPREAHPE